MAYDDIILDAEERMEKSCSVLQEEYKKVRSGRATPGLIENVKVDYYGSLTPLKQLATIGVPEARLLVVRPFDPASLKPIEKALQTEVGITPNNDGKLIRLNVPPLSEERRQQLVGQTRHMAEEARIAIRNVRREAIKTAEKEKKSGEMTEDDLDQFKKDVQEFTDEYTGKVDELLEAKAEELMQV